MHIYLVTRYGSPSNKAGPDGPDTNFLVRAQSHETAAAWVDECLRGIVGKPEDLRPVEDFCHVITEIGHAEANAVDAILHGPWIAFRYLHECGGLPSWQRSNADSDWLRMDTGHEA